MQLIVVFISATMSTKNKEKSDLKEKKIQDKIQKTSHMVQRTDIFSPSPFNETNDFLLRCLKTS